MTVKELKHILSKYPENQDVEVRVVLNIGDLPVVRYRTAEHVADDPTFTLTVTL
jgi:hypothetical protein